MGWLIIIGSLPIVLVGYLAQEYIRSAFRSLWVTAIVLIVFGILLGIADWVGKRNRKLPDLTISHGILYGLAQTLALIPGVSRSGATTTMGLFLGYTRPAFAICIDMSRLPSTSRSWSVESTAWSDTKR